MSQSQFRNREGAKQLIEFSSMRYGKKFPTDIDAFMDFGGKAFVFVEVKHERAQLPFGQKLALERITDAINDSIHTLLLVARHDTPTSEDIELGECLVSQYRENGQWQYVNEPITVKGFTDSWLDAKGVKQ